jgi:tetratricopeptide (TPR) repeat protein
MHFRSMAAVLAAVTLTGTACSRFSSPSVEQREQRGDALAAQSKFAEAAIEYRGAIQLQPKAAHLHRKLAGVYESAGEPQNAFREVVITADLAPDDSAAQLKAAQYLLAARRYEDARTRADAVLARDAANADAIIVRASVLAQTKNVDEARKVLTEAIAAQPTNARLLVTLGAMEADQRNFPAAEDALTRAVGVDPRSLEAHETLARLYLGRGRVAEAESSLRQAAAIAPTAAFAQQTLARLLIETGRAGEAEQPLKALATAAPHPANRLARAD